MIDGIGGQRTDNRNVIGHTPDVREEIANVLAGLAKLLEIMLRAEAGQIVSLALQLGNRLALGDAFRHRFAIHLAQLRLVIERLQMTRAAGHAQVDHPFHFRLVMWHGEDARPLVNLRPVRGQQRGIQQRGKAQAAQAGLAQKGAAADVGGKKIELAHG